MYEDSGYLGKDPLLLFVWNYPLSQILAIIVPQNADADDCRYRIRDVVYSPVGITA